MGREVKLPGAAPWPVLGLTGGIACGKTEACRILQELGAWVVDADRLAHELVRPGQPLLEKVIQEFGREYLLSSGELNRRSLNERIFADARDRKRLEAILHPAIFTAIHQEIEESLSKDSGLGIIAAPLLFESGLDQQCARILVIAASVEKQLERLQKRDGFSRAQA